MMIFAGVDGTGPRNNALYSAEFRYSFVQRMARSWGEKGPWQYQRGPSDLGLNTKDLADAAAGFVEKARNDYVARFPRERHPKVGVFLAGYSRGGAAVIDACWSLQTLGINVDCLVLCDAVQRTVGYMSTTIPSNVRVCYHAVRDPHTFSRNWFGNCGRQVESSGTLYRERSFFCTHGGVGGVPWLTAGESGAIEEDGSFMDASPFRRIMLPGQSEHGNSGRTSITPTVDHLVSEQTWTWISGGLQEEVRKWSAAHEFAPSHRPRPVPGIGDAGI